jgi:hypothetical protein
MLRSTVTGPEMTMHYSSCAAEATLANSDRSTAVESGASETTLIDCI